MKRRYFACACLCVFAFIAAHLLECGGTTAWAHHPSESKNSDAGQVAGDQGLIADWVLWPDYQLPNQAANPVGPRIPLPFVQSTDLELLPKPVVLGGAAPTQVHETSFPINRLPTAAITLEMWLCDHVNKPVGVLLDATGVDANERQGFKFGYYDKQATIAWDVEAKSSPHALRVGLTQAAPYKNYWHHLVVTYDRKTTKLYHNGHLLASDGAAQGELRFGKKGRLSMAAYMEEEPYMEIANLLHAVRIHNRALPASEVRGRFRQLSSLVQNGILFPGLFHFNAGPYLNLATMESVNLIWETDRPAAAKLEWGETAALGNSEALEPPRLIQESTIDGLKPSTPYFYKLTAEHDSGEEIDTGVMTFRTAVSKGEPFKFGLIGDTETRPHINNRIAQLLWEERPNFVVHLGDLTDGGVKDHKFQWNMEYFLGMKSLLGRVPFYTVPGNGEGDLHWYNRYHKYPGEESVYSFTFGDAEFFMLDSNQKDEFAPGGKQYEWLDRKLAESQAKWRFVCHHHAPFTSEQDDYGDAWQEKSAWGDTEIRRITPLYEKHRVDVVMFGHLHLYERTLPIAQDHVNYEHGVLYLLSGGAGGNLEDFAPSAAYFSAKTYRGHHYCTVQIAGDTLTMRMYDLNGTLRDRCKVRK